MDEILDQQFNENEKDETWINRITCFARISLFAFLSYDIYIFLAPQDTTEGTPNLSSIIFALIFVLSFIYYNFILARAEWTRKYITNVTSGIATGFVLVIYIVLMWASLEAILRFTRFDFIGYKIIYYAYIVLVLTLIIWREITYLIRDRRLKRLNNQ